MKREILFYFDYLSNNAWIAWTQIHALAEKYDCQVVPIPVLFAALLKAHGQLGPAEVSAKMRWTLHNTLRKAVLLGIPLNAPLHHPFNPLLALRVSSLAMNASLRRRLVDGLFRAVWVDTADINNVDTVAQVARSAGLEGRDVIAEAAEPAAKARMRQQTDDALNAGVFGVPTMRVDHQLFWGYDDFPFLELYLAGKDPLPKNFASHWSNVLPSAVRRRP